MLLTQVESTITLENVSTDPLYRDDMSMYEKLRIINIRRNEAALKAIGLDTNELTTIARGDKAPLVKHNYLSAKNTKRKRRIPKVPTRFSTRLRNIPAVNYKEFDDVYSNRTTNNNNNNNNNNTASPTKKKQKVSHNEQRQQRKSESAQHGEDNYEPIVLPPELPGKRRRQATNRFNPSAVVEQVTSTTTSNSNRGRQSIKDLTVNMKYLDTNFLGKIIPPLGGQVKRAVMEASCTNGTPKFSRMSGIQKWRNCIQLFVNVYGNGYKNVFLNGGKQITVCFFFLYIFLLSFFKIIMCKKLIIMGKLTFACFWYVRTVVCAIKAMGGY
jgi:hypothetical protein